MLATKCVPLLTYGVAASLAEGKELDKMTFAYNSVFFKLFSVKSKKEIAFAQLHCGFLDFSNLQNLYRLSFLSKLAKNGLINNKSKLDELDWLEYKRLLNFYGINESTSIQCIKNAIYSYSESVQSSIY